MKDNENISAYVLCVFDRIRVSFKFSFNVFIFFFSFFSVFFQDQMNRIIMVWSKETGTYTIHQCYLYCKSVYVPIYIYVCVCVCVGICNGEKILYIIV